MMVDKAGRKNNKNRFIIILAAVLIVAVAGLSLFGKESAGLLTPEQAKQALLREYPGSVESLKLSSGQYVAELSTAQGLYELKLDGASGVIESIIRLKPAATAAAQPTPMPTTAPAPSLLPSTGGSAKPTPTATTLPSAPRVVSEEEAIRLALLEVPGNADDVDTGMNDSGAFYLVEVNTGDGREAVVQVDAISGSIMSVAWEEQDDDS